MTNQLKMPQDNKTIQSGALRRMQTVVKEQKKTKVLDLAAENPKTDMPIRENKN